MNNKGIEFGPGPGAYPINEVVIEEFAGGGSHKPLSYEDLAGKMQKLAGSVQEFRTEVEAAGGQFNGVAQITAQRNMEEYRGSQELVTVFFGLVHIPTPQE